MDEWRQLAKKFSAQGFLYYKQSRYGKAAEMFEAALVIARGTGDRHGEGAALGSLGVVFRSLGQYDKAVKQYEVALEIAREIGDRNGESTWFCNLGDVYINLGQYAKAAEKLESGLEIDREIGDRNGEVNVLGNLGNVYIYLGEYDKAAKQYKAALEIARVIGNREREGRLFANLGNVYINRGQYDKAAEKLEAGLEIAREIGDRDGEGTALGSLGNVYASLGQYDKAVKRCEAALEIARLIGSRNREGVGLGNLGSIYNILGQYAKAAKKYEAGLEIDREIGNRNGEGEKLGNLGNVHMNLGQYDKAVKYFEAALEIAQEIGNRRGEGSLLGNTAIVYVYLRQYDKAAEMFQVALEIAREIGDKHRKGKWLGNLGVCHYTKRKNHDQDNKKALEHLEESIRVFDDLWVDIKKDDQKVTFDDVNDSSSTFAKYLHSLYWNTGHFEDALVTREKASSKSLEILLLEHRKDKLTADDTPGQKNRSSVPLPSVTNFEKMRNVAIQSKSAIIVYALHEDGDILIWVIKSGKNADEMSLVHEKVPVKKEYISLQYLVELARRSLGARDRKHSKKRRNKHIESLPITMPMIGEDKHIADFNDSGLQAVQNELRKAQFGSIYGPDIMMNNALRELYDLLILPIEGALMDEQRLTIIPFGDLFAFPFAALVDQNGSISYPLRHPLVHWSSLSTIVTFQKTRKDRLS